MNFLIIPMISMIRFCCATNQNNPHKYVSYNRSHPLQPCGKFFSWASPIPLGNFYPLAPPPPRNFHWPSMGGGGGWGYGYFLESHIGKSTMTFLTTHYHGAYSNPGVGAQKRERVTCEWGFWHCFTDRLNQSLVLSGLWCWLVDLKRQDDLIVTFLAFW